VQSLQSSHEEQYWHRATCLQSLQKVESVAPEHLSQLMHPMLVVRAEWAARSLR
jgi:hypothetical protein